MPHPTANPTPKPEVIQALKQHQDAILAEWEQAAKCQLPAAQGLSKLALRDSFPDLIARMSDALISARSKTTLRKVTTTHAHERALLTSFTIDQIICEYNILREIILATLARETDLTVGEAQVIRKTLDDGVMEAAREFVRLKSATDNVTDAEARHAAGRLQTIQMITEVALAHSDDLVQLQREVLAILKTALNADTAAILLLVDSGEHLIVRTAQGIEESVSPDFRIPATTGVAGQVLRDLQSVIINDLTDIETASPALKPAGVKSLMVAPLKIERRPIGVVQVGTISPRQFTEDERAQIQIVADRIAIAIDHARLYEQVKRDNEQLTEERELRERFVAMLTHDLRNPVTSVKMGVDMLRRYPDRADVREKQFARIDENLNRTIRMIENLLDARRIQAGRAMDLRIDHFDLAVLLRDVVDEFSTIQGRDVTISGPDHLSGFWDSSGLRRVLENLLTNAAKYSEASTRISIQLSLENDRVSILVHNLGNPISEADQKILFERYVRTATAMQGTQQGWGIGLMLVRGIVQAHGGEVSVESSKEAGTTFKIQLPVDARKSG